jgi:hypothetical protein
MLNDKDFLKELVLKGANADDAYFEYAHIAACLLDKRLYEQLGQIVNGPIYDGDILSKVLRGELFDLGLAVRVCVKGEQGYTGATYFSFSVMKCVNDIKSGKVGA